VSSVPGDPRSALRFVWGLGPTTLGALLVAAGAPLWNARQRRRQGRGRRPAGRLAEAAGLAVFGAGLAVRVWATREILTRGQGTPIYPIEPTRLVTTGLFARSRNPLYIGKLAMLTGLGLTLGSRLALATLALTLGWWAVLHWLVIPAEERSLQERFGPAYLEYAASVPRWLGVPGAPGAPGGCYGGYQRRRSQIGPGGGESPMAWVRAPQAALTGKTTSKSTARATR
jgi:protein-S-isoprenylcysteine O-methyltransferase Ste14